MAFAGLYELWHDPEQTDYDPDTWLWSCAITTTAAAPSLEWLHHRMPVCLTREHWQAWLDPQTSKDELPHLLIANPPPLEAYPVDPSVGNVRKNGPYLLEPWRED